MPIGFRFFAQRDADACAVLDPGGRRWTRGEIERLANQTARALRDLGLKEGDALALISRNRAEYVIVFLAALRSGLHLVPINRHLTAMEIAYVLKDSRAQALIVDSHLRRLVSDALHFEPQSIPFFLSFGTMAGFRDFWDVIDSYSAEPLEPAVAGQVLQYTSATTGRPRCVLDEGTVHPMAIVSAALDRGKPCTSLMNSRRKRQSLAAEALIVIERGAASVRSCSNRSDSPSSRAGPFRSISLIARRASSSVSGATFFVGITNAMDRRWYLTRNKGMPVSSFTTSSRQAPRVSRMPDAASISAR